MTKLAVVLLVLFCSYCCAEGEKQLKKKIRGGHVMKKRGINDFKVGVSWDDCIHPRIGIAMYAITSSPAEIEASIMRVHTNTFIVQDTYLRISEGDMVSESFTVPSSGEDYLIHWVDTSDPTHFGLITLHNCSSADGKKDPHMRTFSGVKYNFQGYCSYTLVKDCRTSRPAFNIYADFRGRFNPTKPPTRMVAVTTEVDGAGTYTFTEDHSVFINGIPSKSHDVIIGKANDHLGFIHEAEDFIQLYHKDSGLSLEWNGKDHEASVTFSGDEFAGKLCGMFGDGSLVKGRDLVKSDGTRTFNTTEFAESWVVPDSCP